MRRHILAGGFINWGLAMTIGRRRMSGFPSLMQIDEALSTFSAHIRWVPPPVEVVRLEEAVGRIGGRDVVASFDVPGFDRSAVDGYAVIGSDTTSASPTNPIEFEIIGRSEAGASPHELPRVTRGQAVEIYTGAPLPANCDAAVMAEFVKREGSRLQVMKPAAPWQNVSRKGEDFRAGEEILRAGTRIRGWQIGALASVNLVEVPVYRRFRIGVLSTGVELREPGENLRPGEIVNSSKPMLKSLIKELGFEPIDLGTVPDEMETIKAGLAKGLGAADMIITTGGTSLGDKDLVPEAINELGEPGLLVHGVLMRPGKPTGIAVVNGKPIFMFSGYPVAALVAFEVFVEPVIERILGLRRRPEAKVQARLTRRVATPVGVRSYVRVRVTQDPKDGLTVDPLRLTGSGILSSMTRANGILVVPESVEGFDEGELVEVVLFEAVEPAS